MGVAAALVGTPPSLGVGGKSEDSSPPDVGERSVDRLGAPSNDEVGISPSPPSVLVGRISMPLEDAASVLDMPLSGDCSTSEDVGVALGASVASSTDDVAESTSLMGVEVVSVSSLAVGNIELVSWVGSGGSELVIGSPALLTSVGAVIGVDAPSGIVFGVVVGGGMGPAEDDSSTPMLICTVTL